MAPCVPCTLAWPVRGRAGPGLTAEAQSFSPCGTTCSGPAKPRRDASFQLRVTWPWGRMPSASGPAWLRRETEGTLRGAQVQTRASHRPVLSRESGAPFASPLSTDLERVSPPGSDFLR